MVLDESGGGGYTEQQSDLLVVLHIIALLQLMVCSCQAGQLVLQLPVQRIECSNSCLCTASQVRQGLQTVLELLLGSAWLKASCAGAECFLLLPFRLSKRGDTASVQPALPLLVFDVGLAEVVLKMSQHGTALLVTGTESSLRASWHCHSLLLATSKMY